jgi:hypothetical protein
MSDDFETLGFVLNNLSSNRFDYLCLFVVSVGGLGKSIVEINDQALHSENHLN